MINTWKGKFLEEKAVRYFEQHDVSFSNLEDYSFIAIRLSDKAFYTGVLTNFNPYSVTKYNISFKSTANNYNFVFNEYFKLSECKNFEPITNGYSFILKGVSFTLGLIPKKQNLIVKKELTTLTFSTITEKNIPLVFTVII